MCLEGRDGLAASTFTAIYWFRRSALQGYRQAFIDLAEMSLRAKKEIFDGKINVTGHSGLPEAIFWFDVAERYVQGFRTPDIDGHLTRCDVCFEKGSPATGFMKCDHCKAMLYCSKKCQAEHWNMGHKVCCKKIDPYRKAVKEAPWRKMLPKPIQLVRYVDV
jgi:MYND finger